MRIHLIAVGGSIMHQLAITLYKKGHIISGSDDEIFDPAYTNLENANLLPKDKGWNPETVTNDLDAVILGMHAKKDNPELQKAHALGLKTYSFPKFVYQQSKAKTRIVIGGSHGKTTITAMVMHVLARQEMDFDYLVGAPVEGFERSVKITDAPLILLEGDEYLSSPTDPTPKFLHYYPQMAVLSGIAWDHMNVFPTFENYLDQFRRFLDQLDAQSLLVYNLEDEHLQELISEQGWRFKAIPYQMPSYQVKNGQFSIGLGGETYELSLNGTHNLQNLEAAHQICKALGIEDQQFYKHIRDFKGAGRRLELLKQTNDSLIFKDFAHAPSKVEGTLNGLSTQYPDQKLVGCLELHTYSSLNKEFLPQYRHKADAADRLMVLVNPHAIKMKNMEPISPEEIKEAFGRRDVEVYTKVEGLKAELELLELVDTVLVLMSSGNYGGLDVESIVNKKGD